ncbi:MAG: S8 family serine peptidase [Bacteroidota bacterium]
MRLLCLFFCLFLFKSTDVWAQEKYWVFFSDKGETSCYLPEDLLSERALANRRKQGIAIDFKDFPVSANYVGDVALVGVKVHHASRWINAVSVTMDEAQKTKVLALPFVKGVQKVARSQITSTHEGDPKEDLDTYRIQLSMLGLDKLHARGYTGQGVVIAVMDNGFLEINQESPFAHLMERDGVLFTRDFVEPGHSVFEPCEGTCRHGSLVLSVLAARIPGQLMGAAPDASYLLFRTEDDLNESHREEDNWLAAAELADSLGANIITSSLGYFDFDPGEGDYTREQLDGNTTIITRAADIAASKGIVVITSAGNSGSNGITAPADGDSVIAVGAVDQLRDYAPFSSVGPSADGQVKPDLVAMGRRTFIYSVRRNEVLRGDGTSFSCPLVSGLAACLLQAAPSTSNMELYDALIQSADRYDQPSDRFGYGVPNGVNAYNQLTGAELGPSLTQEFFGENDLKVYPNPNDGNFTLSIINRGNITKANIRLIDLAGREFYRKNIAVFPSYTQLPLQVNLQPGIYYLMLSEEGKNGYQAYRKISILDQ